MASNLLVYQLVVVSVLVLAPSDILAYSGIGATEDMGTSGVEEMPDEISGLDEINDSNLSGESDDEMSTDLDGIQDENLPEEVMAKQDRPTRFIRWIRRKAWWLARRCKRAFSPLRYRGKKRPLRLYYQAYQHGARSSISNEEWTRAKKSEACSSCVLNRLSRLCRRRWVRRRLGIRNWRFGLFRWRRIQRICKRKILRLLLDLKRVQTKKITCDTRATFRTIDGTCNNLQNPSFGAVGTQFNRLILADYGDSILTPRLAVSGKELPNARDVSRFVHGSNADLNNPNSTTLTHLAMNFGQFMDHDTTLAAFKQIDCEPPTRNPECVNIEIPKDDDTFQKREVDFIELERDSPHVPDSFCKLVPREHTNTITAYIDASNVYGSSKEVAESLRAPGGFLKVTKHPDGLENLLPPQTAEEEFCPSLDPNRPCFLSGDIRNNENPGLNSVHTIFVRHHNRIAKFLRDNNRFNRWNDERIYQETRKIIGAQLQVITYNEFLPLILSGKTIRKFKLGLLTGTQFFRGYNKKVNAQMTAGFSVAAYRFGHSLVQEWFQRFSQKAFQDKEKTKFRPIPVLDFGNPQYLFETCQGGVDAILRGLIKDAAAKADGRFSSSVQENLRRGPGDLSDLISINIQRGRERGVPGYPRYRNMRRCRLPKVRSFRDLIRKAGFERKDVKNLKKVYKRVRDIDLFVGGMLEPRPSDGGVLGPTFQCIIAEQFRRLRVGDRFWHENKPNRRHNTDRTAYNGAMLREIRKTTFAKILCDNADDISAINPKVLMQSQAREACSSLPRVSLRPWITPHKDAGAPDNITDDPSYLYDEDIAV